MNTAINLRNIRQAKRTELPQIADQLRNEIIAVTQARGGHYSASLCTVELSLALHYVFRSPEDRLIWDTGHQCYAHKLITNRLPGFHMLRRDQGVAGFPLITESEHDTFGTGHASTSLAAAAGIASTCKDSGNWTIAIIGDAALAGGPALEALNLLDMKGLRLGIVLNDNGFSISKSVGALSRRRPDSYRSLADAMGLSYVGPLNGHDVDTIVKNLLDLQEQQSFFLHLLTCKGYGDPFAEQDPEAFHNIDGRSRVNIAIPTSKNPKKDSKQQARPTLQKVFSDWLLNEAERNQSLCVLTPGMCYPGGLDSFRKKFSEKFWDVGIAEASAVTIAAGLAIGDKKPLVHIYSTFLQRAVDQLIHDVGLQNLNVSFLIDRVGLCGWDGPTHHGIFDLSFLRAVPNLSIYSVVSERDLLILLQKLSQTKSGAVAIRISKGQSLELPTSTHLDSTNDAPARIIREGTDLTIVTHGRVLKNSLMAVNKLAELGIQSRLIEFIRLRPLLDTELATLLPVGQPLLVVEEHVESGSLGRELGVHLQMFGQAVRFCHLCIHTSVIPKGSIETQLRSVGLSTEHIVEAGRSLVSAQQRWA
ncbi:MAG: 1-deoxy-D-xylulose-5-phosphate synthase [Candidatus Thiodiazotropha endolucinida]|nr:1-deoxy-D-xylulose-5-phosphate synthase [Candidatus Thiodiazotropha taylori]MCG8093494.1 1-deoxy-D-xylulose-5-phosphate synthase [Candidatus Thiodiazotropha endolucinida]MCW4268405.1 1-deoxy-D-xylulose-5-phosphate synthase [Candidatus Thiodiazotropha endolucinida]